jgi:hypothetical protein
MASNEKRCGNTVAEALLTLAERILFPAANVISCDRPSDRDIAQVRTALDFYRCKHRIAVQAIVEEWDLPRIVREIY